MDISLIDTRYNWSSIIIYILIPLSNIVDYDNNNDNDEHS